MALPFDPTPGTRDPRALAILAKTIYRELRSSGYAERDVFSIIISEKGGAERRESFDKNEINVGRVQGNDLMLPKGNVSKHHARLLFRDGRFIVTDLKSTNGTYVNGRTLARDQLPPGPPPPAPPLAARPPAAPPPARPSAPAVTMKAQTHPTGGRW